jgi:hypothetical protein
MTVGDEIRVPKMLLREIELSDAVGADAALDRALSVSMTIEPERKAAEANLLLLARVRQPQIVKLAQSGRDADEQEAAYTAYLDEVLKICKSVTQMYIAAGGDPNIESTDAIRVETFDIADPQVWRVRYYKLIGRAGGGLGEFSGSTIIWRGTKADISQPGSTDAATA